MNSRVSHDRGGADQVSDNSLDNYFGPIYLLNFVLRADHFCKIETENCKFAKKIFLTTFASESDTTSKNRIMLKAA